MKKTNKQHGAVSLFVVIFAALLITVVTVSFIRIMIQNQQQSTANDLSQSAYDSAQAGVEDGKRALLLLQNLCNSSDPNDVPKCTAAKAETCNAAVEQLSDVQTNKTTDGTEEVKVKTTTGSENLNQAYTCVKIITNTTDVKEYISADASKIIPLVGVTSFDSVKIEWFSSSDSATAFAPTLPSTPLPMKASWISNLAPVARAQLIEIAPSFTMTDINTDSDTPSGTNNTLFLYPSSIGIDSDSHPGNFSVNVHPTSGPTGIKGSPATPSNVICKKIDTSVTYSCSATIKLPKAVDPGGNKAYLNLKSLYGPAHYRITLLNSADLTNPTNPISFNNVQPIIDSTGRANNLFRRVEANVEYTNISFPYPQGEINIKGNLCKDFTITNDPAQYVSNQLTCDPAN